MRQTKQLKFWAAGGLLAILLAGCGSAPGTPTPMPTAPSVAQVDETEAPTVDAVVTEEAATTVEAAPVSEETTAPPVEEPTAENVVTESPTVETPPTEAEASTAANVAADGSLIVWRANGAAPGTAANQGGQIAAIEDNGTVTPLLRLADNVSRVMACGDTARSADGRYTALFAGGAESGTLYVLDSEANVDEVASIDYLTCLGQGTLRFAPEGTQYAYISYPAGATRQNFAGGGLVLKDAASDETLYSTQNVVAFDLTSEFLAYLSFFTNNNDQADEAAISLWQDGTNREIITVRPDANCQYSSGTLRVLDDGSYRALLGQRCGSATSWQLYSIVADSGDATLQASDSQPGVFAPFARTNNLYFVPGTRTAWFTVPDGVTGNTVALAAVDIDSVEISVPVTRQAVFPTYSGASNAVPVLSKDGRWLAMVVTSPNADNQVVVVDLSDASVTPISVPAGSRGDLVSALAFTPDQSALLYIAGGVGGADNALFSLNLSTGVENRVARGRFGSWLAVSPDSTRVALLNWELDTTAQNPDPTYTNLVSVDLASGGVSVWAEGADLVDNEPQDLRFFAPLVWP